MPDDRDRPSGPSPSGTDPTIAVPSAASVTRPGGTDATVAEAPSASGAPSGIDATVAAQPLVAATDETIAATSDVSRARPAPAPTSATATGGPASRGASAVRSQASTSRTVGDEMRAASIERFGKVAIDRFELLDELARGGLGRVYRARDPRTNRIVAIKEVLQPRPDIIARFAREALVTANLQHPSIVPVYEVGRWQNGDPFYAMKLVGGRTLDALIADAATAEARVALVAHIIDVADALAYAHSERVIHRDLKPANVLVGSYGETVVIDWGLAKNLATGEEIDEVPFASTIPPDSSDTVIGSVLGTPAYMPPEQAHGEALDERADVYSIGAILYHTLTGARPYADARTFEELMELVTTQPPRPIAALAPDVAPELIAIAEKAMARAPADRYVTAEGLAQDLRRFQAGKLVAAHRYTSRQLVRRWIAQHRAFVLTALVAFGVLIAVGATSVWRIAKERDAAHAAEQLAIAGRAQAQTATALADARFAESLEDLARQAFVVGAADRALPLIAGAVASRGAAVPPTLALLASQARLAFTGLVGIAPAQPPSINIAQLSNDGTRVYSAAADGSLRAWDLTADRALWTAGGTALVELSPDGRALLCVDVDGTLRVRAADSGAVIAQWAAPTPIAGAPTVTIATGTPGIVTGGDHENLERASVLRWSPDGSRFATLSQPGRVFVGAAPTSGPAIATPAPLRELDRHVGGGGVSLEFAPDGQRLATAGADGIAIRDVSTGATLARLAAPMAPAAKTPMPPVLAVRWLDGDRVAGVDDVTGLVRIWRISSRKVERTLVPPSPLFGIIVDHNGPTGAAPRWLAGYGNGAVVTVWNPDTGEVIARLGGHVVGTDFAVEDGARLITADEGGSIFAWNPLSGERLRAIPPEGSIAIVARGPRVVAFGIGRIRVYAFTNDAIIRHLDGHTARVRGLAWSPDSRVVWSASNDGTARGDDLAGGPTRVLGEPSFSEPAMIDWPTAANKAGPHGLRSVTVAPDGTTLATTGDGGAIDLWNAHTGAHVASWPGYSKRVRHIAFTRDGRTAFTVGDTTLKKWEVATGRELAHVELGGPGWDVGLTADGETVATLDDGGLLRLWTSDLAPIERGSFPGHGHEVLAVDHVVIAETRERLVQIEVVAGVAVPRHDTPATLPYAIAASAQSIAFTNPAFEIALLDRATLAPVRTWRTTEFQIAIAFRPDGAVLATAGAHRLRLWDPRTGDLLAESPELPTLIAMIAWSPDGHYLAAAGGAGTTYVWNLAPADPATLAAFVRCVSSWRLEQAALVAAPFDPASCALLDAGRGK